MRKLHGLLFGLMSVLSLSMCTYTNDTAECRLTKDHIQVTKLALSHAHKRGAQDKDLTVIQPYKIPDNPSWLEEQIRERHINPFRNLNEIQEIESYVCGLRSVGVNALDSDSLFTLITEIRNSGTGEYPHWLSISPVGFDSQRNNAAIVCAWTCGYLCGYSKLLFYTKENGEWKFAGDVLLGIS
jgi:hypothetical protein